MSYTYFRSAGFKPTKINDAIRGVDLLYNQIKDALSSISDYLKQPYFDNLDDWKQTFEKGKKNLLWEFDQELKEANAAYKAYNDDDEYAESELEVIRRYEKLYYGIVKEDDSLRQVGTALHDHVRVVKGHAQTVARSLDTVKHVFKKWLDENGD